MLLSTPIEVEVEVMIACDRASIKDNVIHNMAWWLKSAGALNFALSQEQCPVSL